MGYKCLGEHIVVAATVPEENSCRDKVQFYLNGAYHSHKAEAMMRKTWPKAKILGVWHSHICDDVIFSEQDSRSNRQLAKLLNGCASTLVTLRDEQLVWVTYRILPTGETAKMRTIVKRK